MPAEIDFTLEIVALQKAIASGAMRVSYDGKSVEYDTFEGMIKRLTFIQGIQDGLSLADRPRTGFISYSSGDDDGGSSE